MGAGVRGAASEATTAGACAAAAEDPDTTAESSAPVEANGLRMRARPRAQGQADEASHPSTSGCGEGVLLRCRVPSGTAAAEADSGHGARDR